MTALGLLAAAVLLVLNGLFVAAEFAAVSVRRAQLEQHAERNRRAARVLTAQRRLSMLLAGAQFGITLCSLGLGAVAEPSVARVLEHALHAMHLPSGLADPLAFAIALALVVMLHMVLGEMVPKNVAIARPEASAIALVPELDRFVGATRPLIRALNAMANGSLRVLGIEPRDELKTAYTPDELAEIVAESRNEGLLADAAHQRLRRALALTGRTAGDVAVPIERMVTVDPSATPQRIQQLTAATGYSRFPVAQGADLLGYVHIQDTIAAGAGPAATMARPLPRIAPDAPLTDVLVVMQRGGTHLALVGSAGRTVGVLALEDVMGEVVGEIDDATNRLRG